MKAETLQHEQALLYREALEHTLAEVGTVFGEGGEDGLVAGTRFLNTLYYIGSGASSVAVTVPEFVPVTHTVEAAGVTLATETNAHLQQLLNNIVVVVGRCRQS